MLSSQLKPSPDPGARELRLSALQTAGKTHEVALRPLLVPLLVKPMPTSRRSRQRRSVSWGSAGHPRLSPISWGERRSRP